jgi:hypothetical protein
MFQNNIFLFVDKKTLALKWQCVYKAALAEEVEGGVETLIKQA